MENEKLYKERLALIEKAINLEPVDRIPVIYQGVATAPRQMGMTIAKFVEDLDAARDVTIAYMDHLDGLDGINSAPTAYINLGLTLQWLSHIQLPGRELPEDALWQVEEKEVMSVEDYDVIINKGFKAFREQHLPKIIDMAELQERMKYMTKNKAKTIQMFRDHGYVIMSGGITTVPFELLCGARSMTPFILDLYRRPEKVKAALDIMIQGQIDLGIKTAQDSGINRVWLGGWRAASALLAPKIWDEFVFPYFHEIVWALAEKDIVSILHLDQDWTRDLGRLRELPAKKCILNPDGMTDIRKAKELIGDHMAIMGDVPAAMLATGTSDEVYNYVRDLVRDIGPTGLLLCPGCDAPINAKRENMEAFVSGGRDFGAIY